VRVTVASAEEGPGPVVVVGASFGGSLGLLAAADERVSGHLAGVVTFGAFVDLFGVLQASTTGVSLVGDHRVPWDPHPMADEVVRERLADELPPELAPLVLDALAGERDLDELPAEARAVVELLTHDDPDRTDELVAALPDELRERVRAVSPISVAHRIGVPVLAMHSTQDPAIPYGELLRLGVAVPEAELVTLERFAHVDVDLDSPRRWREALGDLRRVWWFTSETLRLQQR
jgi:pimeloyl-ACP methyl ester carboxylesterase